MKNTEYNIDELNTIISSESSLDTLFDLISDMGLEILDMHKA